MRKVIIILGIFLLSSMLLQAYAQVKPDEKLFREAKVLIFDKEWKEAQEILEELLEKYPKSPWFSQALFYNAKCFEEQKGKELEALDEYKRYIKRRDRSESLTEESERSIINIAMELYRRGKKSYLKEVEKRLSSPNKVVKYYAAIKLSYIKDKKAAARGVPVLKEIIREERDHELRDRARIALLRVDPKALKDFEEERYDRKAKVLKIRVWEKGELKLRINIPWALADLVLGAVSEEERELMIEEGYDLDRILKELGETGEIEIQVEETIIKIWIE